MDDIDNSNDDGRNLDALPGDNVTPEPKPTPAPDPTPKPAASDDIRAVAAEIFGQVKTHLTPKEEPRQISQEELKRQLHVFEPDDNFFRGFMRLAEDDPEAAKALEKFKPVFGQLQQGLIKQAVATAQYIVNEAMKDHYARLDSVEQYTTSRRAKELRADFHAEYPALADPKLQKLVDTVGRQLAGQSFSDEKQYFKTLADNVADVIKGYDPEFTLEQTATTTPAKAGVATTPRLPRTSVGGTGGAGGQKSSAATKADKNGDLSSLWEEPA